MSFLPSHSHSQQYPQYQQHTQQRADMQGVQNVAQPQPQGQGQQFAAVAVGLATTSSSSQPLPPAPYSQVHHGNSDHPPVSYPPSLLFPTELFNSGISHQSLAVQPQSLAGYQQQQQHQQLQSQRSSSFSIPQPVTATLSLSLSSGTQTLNSPAVMSVRPQSQPQCHRPSRIPSPTVPDRPTGASSATFFDDLAGLFGPIPPVYPETPSSAAAPPTTMPLATQDLQSSSPHPREIEHTSMQEHLQQSTTNLSTVAVDSKDTTDDHPFPYACPMVSCHRRYKTVKALKQHIVDHANALTARADDLNASISVVEEDEPNTIPANAGDALATRTCSLCGRVFKRKSDCQRHERSHTNERPFACGTCNKRWTRKEGLSKHLRESVSCRAAEELRVNGLHSASPSCTLISPLSQSPTIPSNCGSPASMSPPVATRRACANSKLHSPSHDHLAPPSSVLSLSGSVSTSRAMALPSPLATPPAVSCALTLECSVRQSDAPEPECLQSGISSGPPKPPEPTATPTAGAQQSNLLSRRMMRRPASMMHDASFMIVPPQAQQSAAAVAKLDDSLPSPGVFRLANLRIQRTESLDLSTTHVLTLSASSRPPTDREIQQPPAKRHAGSGSAAVNVPGGPGWLRDTGAPVQGEELSTSPRSRGLARHVFADFTHVPYGANPIGTTTFAPAPHSASADIPSTTSTTAARGTKRPASWSLQSTADALLRETFSRPDTGVADLPPPMGSRREMLDFPLLHMMGGVPHGFGESGFCHSFVGVAPVPSSSSNEPKPAAPAGVESWMLDSNGQHFFAADMSSSTATLAGGVQSHMSLPSLTNLSTLSQSSCITPPSTSYAPAGTAASVQPTPPLSATSSDIKSPSSFRSFSPNMGPAEGVASATGARRGAGNLVRIPSHLSYASSLIASPTLDSFEAAAAVAVANVAGAGMGQQQQGQQIYTFFGQPQPTQHAQPPLVQHSPTGPGQPTMLKLQPIVNPDGSTTIRLPPGFVLAPGPPPPQMPSTGSVEGGGTFAPAAVPQFVVLPQREQTLSGQAQSQGSDLSSWTQVVPLLTQVGMMTPQNGAYILR